MTRQTRVGLLVLAGVLLFLLALFAIANRSFLFSDTFFVKSRYGSVAGLLPGAEVHYQGVNVGRVESVRLPDQPGDKIVVTMAIRETARHLVRDNTQAQIKTDGLVGNQIVVLVNPESPGPQIAEGDFIVGVEPFDLFEITDRALVTAERFDAAAATFQQIMADVQAGKGTLGKIVYDPALYDALVSTTNETQRALDNVADNAEALVAIAQQATEGVNSILTKVDRGEGTLAMMLNDPGVYNSLLATADTLQGISTDLRAITSSAENASNWGALGAFRFAELMEAAKHNWLFKRYFEERGYMEQAPFEVRERALTQTYEELERQRRELLEWQQRLEAREAALDGATPAVDTVMVRTSTPPAAPDGAGN